MSRACRRAAIHTILAACAASVLTCKGDSTTTETQESGVEDLTIVVQQDKSRILEEEEALKRRRETFEAERQRLDGERNDVAKQLSSLSKKDRKQRQRLETAEKQIVEQQQKLRNQISSFENERDKLAKEKTKLLERIATLTQTKGGMTVEQREQVMTQRERDVARREAQLAAREKDLAQREGELVKRFEQAERIVASLQASSGVRVSMAAPASSSTGPATKQSVTKQQRDVHGAMQNKGVLADDLPPSARELDEAANQAIKNKDYTAAAGALTSLQSAVDGVDINQAFVQAKMTRINKVYQGAMAQLNEAQR